MCGCVGPEARGNFHALFEERFGLVELAHVAIQGREVHPPAHGIGVLRLGAAIADGDGLLEHEHRLVEAASVRVQNGEVVHGDQRRDMLLAKDTPADVETFQVERLGLVVFALVLVQDRQVVQGVEPLVIALGRGAAEQCQARRQLLFRLRQQAEMAIGVADGQPDGRLDARPLVEVAGDLLGGPVQDARTLISGLGFMPASPWFCALA